MKVLVVLLVVLAAGKIAVREHLARRGSGEAIALAYHDRALEACRLAGAAARDAAVVRAMNHPTEVSVRIGDPTRTVALWQVDRDDWAVRYRNPQLLVSHRDGGTRLMCIYDVLTASAHLLRS